eukprot:255526_1
MDLHHIKIQFDDILKHGILNEDILAEARRVYNIHKQRKSEKTERARKQSIKRSAKRKRERSESSDPEHLFVEADCKSQKPMSPTSKALEQMKIAKDIAPHLLKEHSPISVIEQHTNTRNSDMIVEMNYGNDSVEEQQFDGKNIDQNHCTHRSIDNIQTEPDKSNAMPPTKHAQCGHLDCDCTHYTDSGQCIECGHAHDDEHIVFEEEKAIQIEVINDKNIEGLLAKMNEIWTESGLMFGSWPVRVISIECEPSNWNPLSVLSGFEDHITLQKQINLVASAVGVYVARFVLGVRERHFESAVIRSDGTVLDQMEPLDAVSNRDNACEPSNTEIMAKSIGPFTFLFIDLAVKCYLSLRGVLNCQVDESEMVKTMTDNLLQILNPSKDIEPLNIECPPMDDDDMEISPKLQAAPQMDIDTYAPPLPMVPVAIGVVSSSPNTNNNSNRNR